MRNKLPGLLMGVLLLTGCGGGTGSEDLLTSDIVGARTGTVRLSDNGCASYRPIPVTEVTFAHQMSTQLRDDNRLNISFHDNGYVCNALGVERAAGRFDASCGIQPLVDFLPGHECTQELIWSYSEPTSDDPAARADVIRTAYVRCSGADDSEFVCPVEYRGTAFECFKGICPSV